MSQPLALESSPDGRHARSDRTRLAIVDALLALLEEGQLRPSAERIAERAHISRRALFNHFSDVEDLLATAAQRRLSQILPTLKPLPTTGTLDERALKVASMFCSLYERVAPVRRAALLAEPECKAIAEQLGNARKMLRMALESAFAFELGALPPAEREEAAAFLCGLTGFSLWDDLSQHQQMTAASIANVVARQIKALFAVEPSTIPASTQGVSKKAKR